MSRVHILAVALFTLLAPPALAGDHNVPKPKAVYAVGDTVPNGLKIADGYPGIDLPTLRGETCYVRTDEFIYTINRETREVLKIHLIAELLIL